MFNLIFTCLACAGLAFGANNIDKIQYQNNDNVVFHQELKRGIAYNDESYTITISADELNDYVFSNLYNYLDTYKSSNDLDSYMGTTTYFGMSLTGRYDDDGESSYFQYKGTNYTYINICTFSYYGIDTYKNVVGHFTDALDDDSEYDYGVGELPFEDSLTLTFSNSTYYVGYKTAIQADILANQPANDNYAGALGDFISIMVAGLQNFGAGVANGVAHFASALFLAADSGGNVTGLSIFGGIIAIFAGLALAVGITTRVYLWVTSLGK